MATACQLGGDLAGLDLLKDGLTAETMRQFLARNIALFFARKQIPIACVEDPYVKI